VRAGKQVLARRLLSLRAGQHASLPVDLDRAGELLASRRASLSVVVHLVGEGRTTGTAAKMKLASTRAPAIRVLTRTAPLDGQGGLRLRVTCGAPRGERCQGRLTLLDRDRRTLAAQPISLPGAATSTVRLVPGGSWDSARRERSATAGPEPLALTGTVTAVSEVPVGLDVRTIGRIAVSVR
jgi:hypothetical protein